MGSIIISKILLLLSFLGLIFLGMNIDKRYKDTTPIPHIPLAYTLGASIVYGIIIGILCCKL